MNAAHLSTYMSGLGFLFNLRMIAGVLVGGRPRVHMTCPKEMTQKPPTNAQRVVDAQGEDGWIRTGQQQLRKRRPSRSSNR